MSKKYIRGVDAKTYARYMHEIEAKGPEHEAKLIRQGKLLPSSQDGNRGIAKNRDNKVFSNRSKVRGRRKKKSECLVPRCDNKVSRRGLCNTHRAYAYKMIERGKTTEANLIKRKLLLPKASGGDQRKSKRKKKISSKKKGKKKKTLKRSGKKTLKRSKSSKKKSDKKRVKRRTVTVSGFPEKLLSSDRCLFPKCKTTRKGGGRGLCVKHYSQYKRKRKKLSDRARRKLDKDLIKRRLLLPSRARIKKQAQDAESSAFEIGSTIRGSIRRW